MVQSFASNLEDLYTLSSIKLGKVVLSVVSYLSGNSFNLLF